MNLRREMELHPFVGKKFPSTQIQKASPVLENPNRTAILTDSSFSSIRKSQLKGFETSKVVKVYNYNPVNFQNPEKSLANHSIIINLSEPHPNFTKAKRVLSLDSDFLGHREPNSSVNTKDFMQGRKVLSPKDTKGMNRLYSVESDLTITGGVADHRLRLSSVETESFAALVLRLLLESKGSKTRNCLNIYQYFQVS